MPKRIEFIAPVDSMRGNLSGNQKLQYALNNNPAYYSPVGQRNYARNFETRFIGAKRASDGLKYFQVKTKNAVGMTPGLKKAMALLGGTGALYAACIMDSTKKAAMVNFFNKASEAAPATMAKYTFKSYWSESIRLMLKEKRASLTKTGAGASVTIQNPWVYTAGSLDVTVSNEVLVKFWSELAVNPIEFTVEGSKGVAHTAEDFDTLISSNYNVLGLTSVGKIKLGSLYLKDPAGEYVDEGSVVVPNGAYTLTETAPE